MTLAPFEESTSLQIGIWWFFLLQILLLLWRWFFFWGDWHWCVCIEIVNEHWRVLHHSLGSHQKPRLHEAQLVLGPIAAVVLVRAIHSCAGISKLACNLRVNEETLVTVRALGEELALVFRMNILAKPLWLAAFRPVFASHLNFFCARLFVLSLIRYCLHIYHFGGFYRPESLQTLFFKIFSLLSCELLLKKWLTHRVVWLLLIKLIDVWILLSHVTPWFTEHHFISLISVLNKVRCVSLLSRPRQGTFVVTHGGFPPAYISWINRTFWISRYTRVMSILIRKLSALIALLLSPEGYSARVTKL